MKIKVFEFTKISISCVGTNDAMDDETKYKRRKDCEYFGVSKRDSLAESLFRLKDC